MKASFFHAVFRDSYHFSEPFQGFLSFLFQGFLFFLYGENVGELWGHYVVTLPDFALRLLRGLFGYAVPLKKGLLRGSMLNPQRAELVEPVTEIKHTVSPRGFKMVLLLTDHVQSLESRDRNSFI